MVDLDNCGSRLKAADLSGQAPGLSNENDAARSMNRDNELRTLGLVHVFHAGGHRTTYQKFLGSQFGLEPVTGPIKWSLGLRLIRADRLAFATISRRTAFSALIIAFFRACIGKRTCAICMEGEWYFDKSRRLRSVIALNLFRLLDALGRLKVFSVIPYDLMPELRKTTSGWILDLCLWDFLGHSQAAIQGSTSLSERVQSAAGERKILLFLGKASRRKGYDELVLMSRKVKERALIVSAGQVAGECRKDADALREMGMFVEDRLVSEDELISLYSVADYVWCRYDEASASLSSGVFGRAVQLQKTTVVRRGSYLHRLAKLLDQSTVHDLEAELSGGQKDQHDSAQANMNSFRKSHKSFLNAMAQRSIDNLRNSL